MAKVTMPLLSGSASGQIGKAMVHFPWHGIAVVRKWLKPTNPEDPDQGNFRMILGGLGRSTKPAADTKKFQTEALACTVTPNTWVSQLVGYLANNYMHNATQFEAIYTAFEAHAAKATFTSDAATLGLTDFDVSYKSTAHVFSKGMQLYMTGLYGCDMYAADHTKFNVAPYTTAIGSWIAANVNAHTAHMTV